MNEGTGLEDYGTDAEVTCPYCGETVSITIDRAGGARQDYFEDCQVCCRPWQLAVTIHQEGGADIIVSPADD